MKKTLIYLGYADPAPDLYSHFYDEVVETHTFDQIKSVANSKSLILFGGGTDVSPALYGAKPSRHTSTGHIQDITYRDSFEASVFAFARANKISMLGICRGGQLLCAMSGGKLIQHVTGHNAGLHLITTDEGVIIPTSSVHHQMMYPFEIPHHTLAWTTKPRSNGYIMDDHKKLSEIPSEPEVVYFQETKALAIQGHPEYMNEETPFVKYTQQLVRQYLL